MTEQTTGHSCVPQGGRYNEHILDDSKYPGSPLPRNVVRTVVVRP